MLLTQITFPYLLCMSLVALFSGVLNSFGKFVESSMVSIVLNLVLSIAIFVGFWLGYHNEPEGGIIQPSACSLPVCCSSCCWFGGSSATVFFCV